MKGGRVLGCTKRCVLPQKCQSVGVTRILGTKNLSRNRSNNTLYYLLHHCSKIPHLDQSGLVQLNNQFLPLPTASPSESIPFWTYHQVEEALQQVERRPSKSCDSIQANPAVATATKRLLPAAGGPGGQLAGLADHSELLDRAGGYCCMRLWPSTLGDSW
eukprot:1158808-Pelagomonas_calceolata.AAC.3